MEIPPSEAGKLSLWEYTGMLHHHNLRADPEGKNEPAPEINDDEMMLAFARAEAMGIGKMPN